VLVIGKQIGVKLIQLKSEKCNKQPFFVEKVKFCCCKQGILPNTLQVAPMWILHQNSDEFSACLNEGQMNDLCGMACL
jgi:hypothetical protein